MPLIPVSIILEVHISLSEFKNRILSKNTDIQEEYRIYLDDTLMTERSWIWSNDVFIKENMYVNIDLSARHRIRVERVQDRGNTKFELKNIHSIDQLLDVIYISESEIDFKII
jgi:hypothetical protein